MNKTKFKLTLAIIKPDASETPHALQIIKALLDREKLRVVQYKFTKLKMEEAERFYIEHRNKFFYNRLVTFMTSGPIHAFILSHNNAIKKWRQLMGPTKVFRTYIENPKSLRGIIGLSDTRNSAHGSDSIETALREIKFFFPDFTVEEWERRGSPDQSLSEVLVQSYHREES